MSTAIRGVEKAPLLRVRELGFSFGEKPVFTSFKAELCAGDIVALIGPNGAGKSTLLKLLAGLLPLQSGEIHWGGETQLSSRERAKRVAWLRQDGDEPSSLKVRDVVELGRYAHQGPWRGLSEQDQQMVDDALKQLRLSELAERRAEHLSGGEKQRVALARLIAQGAPALLLDEPANHLDPRSQFELSAWMRSMAEEGRGLIYATHDLERAYRFAKQIWLITSEGTWRIGSPKEVMTPEVLLEEFGLRASCDQNGEVLSIEGLG